MRERLIPTPDALPAPVVPYPQKCVCSHPDADECRAWAEIHGRRLGRPLPAGETCGCDCHTMKPSPWDWRGGGEK